MKVNLKLKDLREKNKVSQIKLQMDTGIEQALISKYENGKRVPPTETLIVLAEYFNVSIDYLVGRTNNPDINH